MMNKKKPRILIIRCGLLGDTIDSTAVIKPLIDYFGNELQIDWITKPNLIDLFKFDSKISPLILKFTKLPLLINFGKLKIIFQSYLNPYDAVINLEVGSKFKNFARLIKSKIKVGQPYKYVAENRVNEHRVSHQLRILKSYFTDINTDNCYPYLVGSNINVAHEYGLTNKYIVICPSSSKFNKKNHRGDIIDRNGITLARSIDIYSAGIRPKLVKNKKKLLINLKLSFPDLDIKRVEEKLNSNNFFYIKKRLTEEEKTKLWLIGNKAIEFEKNS